MSGRVAAQAGDRRDVDDAPALARNHAGLADRLAEQEDAAHVQVHHLVPGLERMVFGRRAPGRAGVVDQDVDVSRGAPASRRHTLAHLRRVARVGGDPARVDARCPAGAPTASSRSLALRDVSMILAPASPSASAICSPRPREPPVTSAVLAREVEQLLDGVDMGSLDTGCDQNHSSRMSRHTGSRALHDARSHARPWAVS